MPKDSERTIVRGTLLGDKAASDIVIENGKVTGIHRTGRGRAHAGSSKTIIVPPLFDIQVNGYAGINLQGAKVTPEDVILLNKKLAATGVAHWIPTLITGAQRDMEHGCAMLAEALRTGGLDRAIPGIHMEGPYISPEDGPRGAHARKHVRKPSLREFDRLQKAADGKIIYTTVAPEVPGAIAYIRTLARRGIVVALGHHAADADTIHRAVDAGASLVTHLGNGIAAQINRHYNPIWPQLADDRLTCSLIADLHHLPVPVLQSFSRAKGAGRIILTSDVVHIAGLKAGRYELGGMPVDLSSNQRISLSGTELLAGSALMLLQGVVNVFQHTHLSLAEAHACATAVPAKLFGLRERFDLPKAGKKAQFIAFDIDKTRKHWKARIQTVYIRGQRKA